MSEVDDLKCRGVAHWLLRLFIKKSPTFNQVLPLGVWVWNRVAKEMVWIWT